MTTEDVGVWLNGEQDENIQFVNEDEISEDVTKENEDKEKRVEEVFRQLFKQISGCSNRCPYMSVTWAEENGVNTSDVLVLKRLQEQVYKKVS